MEKTRAFLKRWWPYVTIGSVVLLLFYKTIIFGRIPFPGDLLLSEYAPWRHASYAGYAPGAVPSKAQYFDVVRELYPWKIFVVDQVKKFHIPLWNPYNFSGSPLLANFQSQVFYPPGILYLILPMPIAWTLLVILQPLLGSVFLYLFAAEIGLSSVAAVTAALLFNFSGFANVWMEFNTVWHTILWLPFLLFLFERNLREKRVTPARKLLYIFALFSSATGGHPQDFIYVFLFALIYEVSRIITVPSYPKKEKRSLCIQMSLITVIPLLLAGPQLLATVELFRYSSRVPHDVGFTVTTLLVQWWQLVLVFVQDFFGNPATHSYYLQDTYVNKALSVGISGFILVVFGLFLKKRTWHYKFFLYTSFVLLVLTVNMPITRILYRFPIPILSTGSPTRILSLFALALAVLAGYGFDYLRIAPRKKLIVPLLLCGLLISALWLVVFMHPSIGPTAMNTVTSKRALIIVTLIYAGFAAYAFFAQYNKKLYLGIFIIIFAELFYTFTKFNPFVPASFMYPTHPVLTYLQGHSGIFRFWGYGTTRIESNLNLPYKLYTTDGTDPLNLSWYNKFIQSGANGKIPPTFNRTTRSDVALTPGYGETDLPGNQQRLRIMNLLGVKYILDRYDNPKNNYTFTSDHFKSVYSTDDGYTVYENIQSLPRAFFVSHVQYYRNDEDFSRQFFSPTFDPGTSILIPAETQIPPLNPGTRAKVMITSYESNSILMETDSDGQQMLFLSDTWAPGWTAKVDNKPSTIYRADYAFRAILVPKGSHVVHFTYLPAGFIYGILLSFTGVIMILCLITFRGKSGK